MKILVISQHYYPEAFSITNVCEEFAKRGHQVTVITGRPCYGENHIYSGYEQAGESLHNGVRIIRLKNLPREKSTISLIRNYLSFWHLSKHFVRHFQEKYDIVFSVVLSPITAAAAGNIYSRRFHVKHIHNCLDLWPDSVVAVGEARKKSLKYWLLYHLSRSIYKHMDKIIVSSPSFVEYFHKTMRLPDMPVVFIPQPAIVGNDKTLKPIQYGPKFNLIYAGNIGRLQMVDHLVEACGPFKDDPNFCFHILGVGSELSKVLQKIKDLGLESTVRYEGKVSPDQIWRYYANASVLIGALKSDGTYVSRTIPNKLITYMSFGKPIIFVASGDAKAIANSSDGCIVCGEQVKEITEAICFYKRLDNDLLKKKGQDNLSVYKKNFEFSKIIDQLLNCLSQRNPN
jgi:glycosyltransferase involved in cell wall biosynthesis